MESRILSLGKVRKNGAAAVGMAVLLMLSACGGGTPAAAPSSAAASSAPAKPSASSAPASSAAASSAAAKPSASAPAASAAAPTGSPIKIGFLADTSSQGAIEAAEMRINTDLVVNQINSTGGIKGHPVQVTYVDPKQDPTEAIQMATQLIQQDKVDVLMGAVLSSECLGVENLVNKLHSVVYLASDACSAEDLTAKSCNKYTFRVFPVGKQLINPVIQYLVKTYGPKWGIIYPDYAFGQSQKAAAEGALKAAGGQLTVSVPVPLGEMNMTPYVSKIPTDGSIAGLFNYENGTDLARAYTVMGQFGITKKMPVVGTLGKESFGGVYPDAATGAVLTALHISDGAPGNKDDQAYVAAFKAQLAKEPDIATILGGADKGTPGVGLGYQAFISASALRSAMRASGFTGRADTDKLIAALENLNMPQGPDSPTGPTIMNKADHQGRVNLFVVKVNGQKEDVLQTFPANTLPLVGNCQVK